MEEAEAALISCLGTRVDEYWDMQCSWNPSNGFSRNVRLMIRQGDVGMDQVHGSCQAQTRSGNARAPVETKLNLSNVGSRRKNVA
jgi:hypothetical protein